MLSAGSGPGQSLQSKAAMAQVGCLDLRIDRLVHYPAIALSKARREAGPALAAAEGDCDNSATLCMGKAVPWQSLIGFYPLSVL
jgi:hypothetical protein